MDIQTPTAKQWLAGPFGNGNGAIGSWNEEIPERHTRNSFVRISIESIEAQRFFVTYCASNLVYCNSGTRK